jgi:hypothetical protein
MFTHFGVVAFRGISVASRVLGSPERITRDSYIGGLPFWVEGSPLSSIAANGS